MVLKMNKIIFIHGMYSWDVAIGSETDFQINYNNGQNLNENLTG